MWSFFSVMQQLKVSYSFRHFATVSQGHIQNSSGMTGAFHQTPVTVNYTACSVNNYDEMG